MEIGIAQLMASFGCDSSVSDHQVYREEIALAEIADTLDYDHIWTVEHHFENYSFCPDNFVYLSNLAARTQRIRIATGAVIVPWHLQPMRIAERAAMLDQLTEGRFMLGLGRGLARREFDQFGISMDESRERYDEAAPLILEALETGVWPEHEGKYFKTPQAPLRPEPYSNEWRDTRLTQVAMSPDSGEQAAKLGAQVMAFNYKPIEVMRQEYEEYKAHFRRFHGRESRPMLMTEMMVCDSDAARAKENAERYVANYGISVLDHYEMLGEQFDSAKGYPTYAEAAKAMREVGKENVIEGYVNQQIWGTPDQILRRFEERFEQMGDYGILCVFRFGGTPLDVAERSMRLFNAECIPVLRGWAKERAAAA